MFTCLHHLRCVVSPIMLLAMALPLPLLADDNTSGNPQAVRRRGGGQSTDGPRVLVGI